MEMSDKKKIIQFKHIVKSFDNQIVLKGVDLDIYENEFVTLLGPSGCGKTTLLRILGGFLEPTEGMVILNGEDIKNVPPYKRELNTVFQKYALFPHMNVYDNIAFGLKIKKVSKDILAEKLAYYSAELNVLHPFREGNGRTIREYTRQMALYIGYNMNYSRIKVVDYIEASIFSIVDTSKLKEIYIKCLEKIDGV